MKKNWKTTLLGILSIAAAAAPQFVPVEHQQTAQQVVGLLTGLGLIAAKDSDK